MSGISSLADLQNQISANGYEDIAVGYKALITSASFFQSTWPSTGSPAAGGVPATTPGTAYTSPVVGAIANPTNAGGFPNVSTKKRYLSSLSIEYNIGVVGGTIILVDRLVAVSGIALTSAATVTVNTAALPRYTSGTGIQAWLEITTALSVAAPAVNLQSYTDDVGNSGISGSAMVAATATLAAGSLIGPLPLHGGGNSGGIVSVQTIAISNPATTGIANLVLLKPIANISLPAEGWVERDQVDQSTNLPQIFDGACLHFLVLGPSGATPIQYQLRTVYK